jgi:hypothetical protein
LKQSAATEPLWAGKVWKMLVSRNSTALVLVARPDTPVMLRCAASGPSRKVAVEVHRRRRPAGRVETHRHAGGPLARGVAVHAQRERHIGVGGEPDRAEGHRLERLLGNLAEHRGGIQADLGAGGGLEAGGHRIAVGAEDRVQGEWRGRSRRSRR